MSLRKISSVNSTSPLKNNKMDPFSYGVDVDGNNIYAEDNNDDDYDKSKKPSPASGNSNNLFANLPKSLSLSPSPSYEQPQPQFTTEHRRRTPQSSSSSSLPPPFVMQVTAIASLGGVLFGYDMGVIAGALPQLATAFDLTESQQELVVSILYVGGGLGAAFGGSLCDFLGRKPAILGTDVTFMIGASVLFTAPHLAQVCVGRVVVGFAVAVSGIADVSYLHEIAPPQWRGAIVSVNEACISLGFLLAFVVGAVFTTDNNENNTADQDDNTALPDPPRGWRYMFGLGGVLALIQFIGMWSMPESPIWLKDQGRHDEARAALRQIQGGNEPIPDTSEHAEEKEEEKDDMDDNNNYEEEYNHTSNGGQQQLPTTPPRTPQDVAIESKASYASLSSDPDARMRAAATPNHNNVFHKLHRAWHQLKQVISHYRRQVWIAIFLSVTQQFCGQTSVLNYAPTILRAVVQQDAQGGGGGDEQVSGWATLSIGIVKFIATVLVIWKIESIGRRTLLLLGMGTIAFGLLLVAIAFSASSPFKENNNAYDDQAVVVQKGSGMAFALPGVLLVVSGYSMSFGPLTWLITSELFPTDIRGRALGASTIVTYLCAALVTYSFLTTQSLLGTTAVFLIYMIITIVGMVFACLAIPDTGGKTQDEIDADLSNMTWWRRFSRASEPKRLRRRESSSTRMEEFPPGTVMNGAGRLVEAELT